MAYKPQSCHKTEEFCIFAEVSHVTEKSQPLSTNLGIEGEYVNDKLYQMCPQVARLRYLRC